MPPSRREFLALGSAGLLGAAMPADSQAPPAQKPEARPTPTPGAPPAFGTAPPVGPPVTSATFAEAEKLVHIEMTAADRAQAAGNWQMQMAPVYERRAGPRKIALEATLAPATQWNPHLPGIALAPSAGEFLRSSDTHAPLPASEEEIAFALD